jgi:signal transduction histidine kinase
MSVERLHPQEERKNTFRSLVVAAGMLVVVVLAALTTHAETARSRRAVITAMNLERSLSSLLTSIQNAETGQRGYLITGDEAYLEPYLISLRSTPKVLVKLGDYIKPGPDLAAFERLKLLIRAEYEELTAAIGYKRAGNKAKTLARVNSNKGMHLMDNIREEIALLKSSEMVRVDEKISRVNIIFQIDLALRVVVFAGLFVILYFLYSRLRPLIRQLEETVTEKDEEIATRIHAEDANNILINTLRNKNEDLDHFAYIASHDLKEPLRTIDNFIGVIEEEQGEAIGPESRVYFSFIHDATTRMRTLIDTLLNYSQLGRSSQLQTVNLNQLIADVRKNLHARTLETEAIITTRDLPEIECYPVELTQLFQNLIGNALKFTKEGEKPVVEIFHEEGTSYRRVSVKDNGIGMNETAVSKIFQMFSRVNEPGAFEGHGIGLAFCRKIAEQHGGELTVDSSPGVGSTFHLTLPLQQKQNEKETA